MNTTDSLQTEEYQAIIGPSLHAAADIAAARDDPDLFNDLASMLALMAMVRDLADLYQYHMGAMGQMSPTEVFQAAPIAACVIVLKEQDLEDEAIAAMTQALKSAYEMLNADAVLGAERIQIQKAWDALQENNKDLMHEHMKQAARTIVNLIDTWEVKRELG